MKVQKISDWNRFCHAKMELSVRVDCVACGVDVEKIWTCLIRHIDFFDIIWNSFGCVIPNVIFHCVKA